MLVAGPFPIYKIKIYFNLRMAISMFKIISDFKLRTTVTMIRTRPNLRTTVSMGKGSLQIYNPRMFSKKNKLFCY